ncbi:MAG: LamG domain-containing protein [Myxococcales bacterium]
MSRDGGVDQFVGDVGSANGADGIDDGVQVVGSGGTSGSGGGGSGGNGSGGGIGVTGGNTGDGGKASGGDTSNSGGVPFDGSAGGGTSTGGAPGGTGGASTGTGGQTSGGTGGAVGGGDPDLVLWYKFDESSGTTAADSSTAAGAPHNGTLATMGSGATISWSTMPRVGSHAVILTPAATSPYSNGAYVTVPASMQTLAPGAVTIALWVNLAAATPAENWEKLFDFGSGPVAMSNVNMTARAGDPTNTPLRFVITNSGHAVTSEQRLESPGPPLTANIWHHIAVVLPAGSPYTGTLYIDGAAVATNRSMTIHPGDLGATSNNWLGRSQFSNDPYFRGQMDDFRIYRRALIATEIIALFAVH